MKKVFILSVLPLLLLGACKKSDSANPALGISVTVNDSVWSLKNVSFRQDEVLHSASIFGTDDATGRTVDITMFDYSIGKRYYTINSQSAFSNGNTAFYSYKGAVSYASTGTVQITSFSGGLAKGTFAFAGGNADVTGTFTVPIPQ